MCVGKMWLEFEKSVKVNGSELRFDSTEFAYLAF